MTYKEYIKSLSSFSMDDFIRISKEMLPQQYKFKAWNHAGNHGKDLLQEEYQLLAYVTAYGEMHQTKCRVGFQNFDFESLQTNFEVVDWACGQGIATLTMIDILREHNKLYLMRKVTLIEPSQMAIGRAVDNVSIASKDNILISPINNFLPGDGTKEEIDHVQYQYSTVIHLFSNILDIETVNLSRLAKLVADNTRTHYIMCFGPKSSNAYRIDQFCSVFNPDSFFSKVSESNFGYTSDTHHYFSCYTRCFKYNGSTLNLGNMHQFVAPTLVAGKPVFDDYDPMLAVQNGVLSTELANLYVMLGEILDEKDSIYIKPTLNGDTPDLVVIRPGKGVMIIHSFEQDLSNYSFGNYPNSNTPNASTFIENESGIISTSPIGILKEYQQNIIKLHIEDLLGKSLMESAYWTTVKMLAYFPKHKTSFVQHFFESVNHKYIYLYGNDVVNEPLKSRFLQETEFDFPSRYFDSIICQNFYKVLSPTWHSCKQGVFSLDSLDKGAQKDLAKSEPKTKRKINGVAGSGKTQVLACRAINAMRRSNGKVLILTFNLSLVNYIKYRLNEIRADFSWNSFSITNYHQLIKSVANNYGVKLYPGEFDNEFLFEEVANKIRKFATILIDEVQDYKSVWLQLLNRYFLEDNGEFIVFGDAKQNIYNRPVGKKGEILIEAVIGGTWNNSLKKGRRFSNPSITKLAMRFQQDFYPEIETETIEQKSQQTLCSCSIKYYPVGNNVTAATLESNCRWLMQEFKLMPENIVVLSQTCDILRDIDLEYRKVNRCQTMTTFESFEQFEQLKRIHNVSKGNPLDLDRFKNDIEQIRRNKKLHFTMGTKRLKLSTIHSYKGWEANTVILIIEPIQNEKNLKYAVSSENNVRELIYTAITRAKENLFILNMGNEINHDFFAKHIKD